MEIEAYICKIRRSLQREASQSRQTNKTNPKHAPSPLLLLPS